jgi:hypothetical protein
VVSLTPERLCYLILGLTESVETQNKDECIEYQNTPYEYLGQRTVLWLMNHSESGNSSPKRCEATAGLIELECHHHTLFLPLPYLDHPLKPNQLEARKYDRQ